jgi:uncharacterized protein (TIRG00374 family)
MDWRDVGRMWRGLHAGSFVAALALNVLLRFLSASKWQLLLEAQGMKFSYSYLLRVIWISNVLGHVLPAGLGGDNFRMLAMAKGSGRAPEIISTVLVERITGVIALAALAVIGGVWSLGHGLNQVVAALVLPIAVLLAVLILLWTEPGYWLVTRLLRRMRWLPGQQFFVRMHEAAQSYRSQPAVLAMLFALSLLSQLDRVVTVYVLAKAMGVPLWFWDATVLVPVVLFISMLPVSISSIGVQEGAFVVLLRLVGIGSSAAVGLSLLSRLVTFIADAPGLFMFMRRGLAQHQWTPVIAGAQK